MAIAWAGTPGASAKQNAGKSAGKTCTQLMASCVTPVATFRPQFPSAPHCPTALLSSCVGCDVSVAILRTINDRDAACGEPQTPDIRREAYASTLACVSRPSGAIAPCRW